MQTKGLTDWMSGHFGLMSHWLFPGVLPEFGEPAASLDEAVDAFRVDRLLEDIAGCGADWYIFTIGQNTGCYASPNAVIETLAGPGHCSQRDLVFEIANGLHAMGKRFIAYLPCEVAANTSLHAGFRWNKEEGTRQEEFQELYTGAVAEWSRRLGNMLDGWWFDGCYTWPIFHSRGMAWKLWFEAARAGNPAAALTFNDGSFCSGYLTPVHPDLDYLPGEIEMLIDGRIRVGRDEERTTHLPEARFVPGTRCQWHGLLPVDCFWMHGSQGPTWVSHHPYRSLPLGAKNGPMESPLYSDAELGSFMGHCLQEGGALTFNVGIYQEGYFGLETIRQIKRIRQKTA